MPKAIDGAYQQASLHSEEVQEIIESPPKWLIKWGISVLFFILIGLLCISYSLKYPDLINASFRLSSQDVPKAVVAKLDARIGRILVKEGSYVEKNETVAYLENTADYSSVLRLSAWISSTIKTLNNSNNTAYSTIHNIPTVNNLGELQNSFSEFHHSYISYLNFQPNGYFQQKSNLLKYDLQNLNLLHKNLAIRKQLTNQDLEIEKQNYLIQQKLFKEKAISEADLKISRSKLINKSIAFEEANASLLANDASQNNKKNEIIENTKSANEQKQTFIQALNTLKSAVELWKEKYCLVAPNAGQVSYTAFWQEKQNISSGQEFFWILSDSKVNYGTISLNQNNLGKVHIGNTVIIKFDSYPYQEHGLVYGKISFIGKVAASDNSFLVKVSLPQGLTTTYHRKLAARAGMTAQAQIMTDDERFIEKIFYSFRKALR